MVVQCFTNRKVDNEYEVFILVSDIVTLTFFLLEMISKVIAFGLIIHPGSYLRNMWNVFDLIINIIDVATVGIVYDENDMKSRILLGIRSLRMLRFITHFSSLRRMFRVYSNKLSYFIITIIISIMAFYSVSLVGNSLYSGESYSCNDITKTCYPYGDSIYLYY